MMYLIHNNFSQVLLLMHVETLMDRIFSGYICTDTYVFKMVRFPQKKTEKRCAFAWLDRKKTVIQKDNP